VPCYHPIGAWQRGKGAPLSFHEPVGVHLQVPCGQCIGCRLERSRQWAVRIMHEASLHDDNCFLTLTYSDANLPSDGSLRVRDFQLFAKRLRKRAGSFRFFHCGEYGEESSRPHYHACMFGIDFPDKRIYSESLGNKLYESEFLDEVWGLGAVRIGSLTFESAAYVARYVLKKVTGDAAEEHYKRVDLVTGAEYSLQPEYVTMSRRPGIGREWFERFGNEVYPSDNVIARGFPSKPPRYYDSLLEAVAPDVLESVKDSRLQAAERRSWDSTPKRLKVRERVAKARVGLYARKGV